MDPIHFSLYFCLYLFAGFALTWWAYSFLSKQRPDSDLFKMSQNTQVVGLLIATVMWPALAVTLCVSVIDAIREAFSKKVYVRVDWNTDADGRWYERDAESNPEDDPCTLHGPFKNVKIATRFMNEWPDDKDIYDMYILAHRDVPKGAYVNDPADIYWWQPR